MRLNTLLLYFDQWRENARNEHVFTMKRKTKEALIKNDGRPSKEISEKNFRNEFE